MHHYMRLHRWWFPAQVSVSVEETTINIDAYNDASQGDLQWMWNMGNWSDDEVRSMKESVSTLMEASSEQVSANDNKKSLPQLLQAFFVGTERRKMWKEKSKLQAKTIRTWDNEGYEVHVYH